MFNYSSDSLWLVTQVLISPWWFFASISGFIFIIVRSVLTTAKNRTVYGGLDKFLRTTVLIAEIFAMLGVAGIAGYVGKTILQSYLTQAQLEIERAPTKL